MDDFILNNFNQNMRMKNTNFHHLVIENLFAFAVFALENSFFFERINLVPINFSF